MIGIRILRKTNNLIKKSFVNRCIACYHSMTLTNIHNYGTLVMKCPLISTHIKCINPHDVPDGDKSFISLISPIDDFNLRNFSIDYQKEDSIITILLKHESQNSIPEGVSIHVQVPHIYNLDIDAQCINVKETEGETLKILSESDCTLGKIKTLSTDIVCGGSLSCINFLGDGYMKILGNVSIKKLQSKKIFICSNDIDVAALYSPDFKCESECGNINIQNLHGVGNVVSGSGSVCIGSSDGDLHVQTDSGNIDVTIERCKHTYINSNSGDIDVGLGDQVSAFIEAEGVQIDVPEDLLVDGMKNHLSTGYQHFEGRFGDGVSSIEARTNSGNILFCRKNWFSKFDFTD